MSTLNFLPQNHDLVLWAGDTAGFEVAFTDADGAPTDVTGTWEAAFVYGGKIDVDDTAAATGLVTVTIVDTTDVAPISCWHLRRTDLEVTYLQGQVRVHGC